MSSGRARGTLTQYKSLRGYHNVSSALLKKSMSLRNGRIVALVQFLYQSWKREIRRQTRLLSIGIGIF